MKERDIIEGFKRSDIKVMTDLDELKKFIEQQKAENVNLLMMTSGTFGGLKWDDLATFTN